MEILIEDLVNGCLALSALRGDVTGRGSMLVDNDAYALEELIRLIVPGILRRGGVEYKEVEGGWEVSGGEDMWGSVFELVKARLGIAGEEKGGYVGDVPLLRGYGV